METLINTAINLSDKLLSDADKKLLDVLFSDNSKDVYLTVPEFILELFERVGVVCKRLNISAEKREKLQWLNSIYIFPSTDWAITLYHKHYSLANKAWMITKLPLMAPLIVNDENLKTNIIYLNDFIAASEDQMLLN